MNLPQEPYFIAKNIKAVTRSYIEKHSIKAMVLGVSGGLDSAVVAALHDWLRFDISLIGISLPSNSNKNDELIRARQIGAEFCTQFTEYDIESDFKEQLGSVEILINKLGLADTLSERDWKIIKGNIKARIRMNLLYSIAGFTKGMVLSTDNWTEYMLGFWTLHGDVGDFGMIQHLWKTEVYQLAKEMVSWYHDDKKKVALQNCIDATPTDGLGITNSDLDQIGAESYEEVDTKLNSYLTLSKRLNNTTRLNDRADTISALNAAHVTSPVVQRMIGSEFKRNNPYNIPREVLLRNPHSGR